MAMEIRKMAELHALYPETQKGIVYDSPELLLMQYIADNSVDRAMTLFRRLRDDQNVFAVVSGAVLLYPEPQCV